MDDSDGILFNTISLPLTNLFYASCGDGPPLVMVPATISRASNYLSLIRFIGQEFTTHFFELPGHGGSSPFEQPFSSELVGQTVEHFIDALGYETVTIMGFSFGGILTLRVLNQMRQRVKKLVMISPCVSHKTLRYSAARKVFLKVFLKLMRRQGPRKTFLNMMHNENLVDATLSLLKWAGHVEIHDTTLRDKLLTLPESTLDVLSHQVDEILNTAPILEVRDRDMPCVFGMSRLDPLLDYDSTRKLILERFSTVWVESFNLPYHQPPTPFNLEELNRDYGNLLQKFISFPEDMN